jgi:X-Pro dipeptidyl-peptidase (S15 family)
VPISAPDNARLLTDVYLAKPSRPRPVILLRSPYGRAGVYGTMARLFAERGYHAVVRSTRGTFGSEGQLLREGGQTVRLRVGAWHHTSQDLFRHEFYHHRRRRHQHDHLRPDPGSGEPLATARTLLQARQSVHHDPPRPSAIVLPKNSPSSARTDRGSA